jgi:hypothetical protein
VRLSASDIQKVVFSSPSLFLSLIFGKMGNSSKDDSTTDGDTSSGDTPPSNSGVYSEGEKVLAYHGPRIYEAKAHTPFLSLS